MSKVKKVRRGGVSFASSQRSSGDDEPSPRQVAKENAAESAGEIVIPGQMEFEMSESIVKLAKAFVSFRKTCPNMDKDRQGYNYKYTTLGNIISHSRDHLHKNGLAVTQFPIAGKQSLGVITMLVHESGEFIRGRFLMPIPTLSGTNVTQDAGAAITYARRYALSAVLCVASDEDTDASFEASESGQGRSKLRKRR